MVILCKRVYISRQNISLNLCTSYSDPAYLGIFRAGERIVYFLAAYSPVIFPLLEAFRLKILLVPASQWGWEQAKKRKENKCGKRKEEEKNEK